MLVFTLSTYQTKLILEEAAMKECESLNINLDNGNSISVYISYSSSLILETKCLSVITSKLSKANSSIIK